MLAILLPLLVQVATAQVSEPDASAGPIAARARPATSTVSTPHRTRPWGSGVPAAVPRPQTSSLASPPSNDACALPDVLVGTGTFSFDNSLATTGVEGQAEILCDQNFAGTAILHDIWFTWTAPIGGRARLTTCTQNEIDTKIAIYAGAGCPTNAAIACVDDSCGAPYASTVEWPVNAGQSYTIQLGCYPGALPPAVPGASSFDIDITPSPSNDTCAAPLPVVGYGVTQYDNAAASTGLDGQNELLCNSSGVTAVHKDLWYTWTASVTATVRVRTCASAQDTKIAVYGGAGCPNGPALACSDDACGLQSELDFQASAGATYTLQIGLAPGAPIDGVSRFEILDVHAPANDACANAAGIQGPGPHAYDTSFASTGAQGQAESACAFQGGSPIRNDVWFRWRCNVSGVATLTTCNGIGVGSGEDTKVAVYEAAGCPTSAALACNDDDGACGTSGLASTLSWNVQCGAIYSIQVGRSPNASSPVYGTFTISESGSICTPGNLFCFGDANAPVPCPCGNAGAVGNGCANSVNPAGGHLSAMGNPSIAFDTLVLRGSGMPNGTALYYQGGSPQVASPFGDGLRCLNGGIVRLGAKTNVAGASAYPTAGDVPISVRTGVSPGNARSFQVWYRNAAAFCTPSTFNITNALSLAWWN